tara:strand:- start:8542 stop:8913 length:372 start_codon:yes stop_codon:yes gene_type:complete
MKRWTPDEVLHLQRSYGSTDTAAIARKIGRTEEEVDAKAASMSLSRDKTKFAGQVMPRWSSAEVQTIREMYPASANLTIAKALGRSVRSVVSMAHKLKLKKDGARLQDMGRENVLLRRDRLKS